jgi:CDP-glucose 4,6-dehydratase
MEVNSSFWKNRSVFVTGHTGFKGGWISLWLSEMGAIVHGFSLDPPTIPNFFENINIKKRIKTSVRGDIRDLTALKNSMQIAKPSVIFHMAAQSLVRHSYDNPIDTFSTLKSHLKMKILNLIQGLHMEFLN